MKIIVKKKNSLYVQMALLLVAATAIAFLHFIAVDSVSEELVDWYMVKTDYARTQNHKAIENLQEYITDRGLNSRDSTELNEWVKKQWFLSLVVYKNGIQVFDSRYPDQAIWEEEISFTDYEWSNYSEVEFADGVAEIQVNGAYGYQVYNAVRIIELGISFLIFLLIVLAGIRKKMNYIQKLSDEVEVLEGGGLQHPITISGNDELSGLAKGLESMRLSFLTSQEKEETMIRENQRVITEMSHDLRTPVTAIILYAEILRDGKCKDEGKQKTYLEKIHQKALLLKERSDRLLGYSLTAGNKEELVMESGIFSEVFFDPLSEACGYLDQNGFKVDLRMSCWPNRKIMYNSDHVARVMDNIVSNIVKYADKRYPVVITQTEDGNTLGLSFQNWIIRQESSQEGFSVGVQSIQSLMKEMDGYCHYYRGQNIYSIEISFPVIQG